MYPVKSEDLETLVEQNTILFLDMNSWPAGYVRRVIERSPSYITTKDGNKTLPAELWYMILSFLEEHQYWPVYPVKMSSVQLDHENREPAFICNIVTDWRRFGSVENPNDLHDYENYLMDPIGIDYYDFLKQVFDQPYKDRGSNQESSDEHEHEGEEEEEEKEEDKIEEEYEDEIEEEYEDESESEDEDGYMIISPFIDMSKTVLPDQSFTIPVSDLDSEQPFLYWGVRAPEMISWLEEGKCELCRGAREFCVGCLDGRDVLERFTGLDAARLGGDCGTIMLCPLCIGEDYAKNSVYATSDRANGNMSVEEFAESCNQRMKELGYKKSLVLMRNL
ncbi:hypothetical protein FPOAC2_12656 [Fusarium poae]|jgi:hypothetical protein|uniref:hypothetical protein n=1 Tax=Fusarium poae TaxID=36050 RepID=UPI001CE99DBE|nr:hypothetical protein FPOAC1_012323 [Fusarium poae]KAG8667491.1 hypothetical protein FPOAC1_012323 [Fusarium poae]